MVGNQTTITDPSTGQDKDFAFDYSFWSFDESQEPATQDTVFDALGANILTQSWSGFNTTLFAYGQTGSGKSYSMMGYGEDTGIIPRVGARLFEQIDAKRPSLGEKEKLTVEVSYLEIYNEKIKDLLNPNAAKQGASLKVRESQTAGIYVEGLSRIAVQSYADIERLIDEGGKARTVAATAMNATSSRSHSVFTIIFTQLRVNADTFQASDVVSKINLVDLAGSERADSTGATGDRLKEGCAINKSLSALGNVISALADAATSGKKGPKRVIPYRDSTLTRLLQESLGGNAKTVMIAALSPAGINYDETLSTLRYANRAKQIKNQAKVNENPNEKLIRELKEEIARLKALLTDGGSLPAAEGGASAPSPEEVARVVEENERMLREMNMSWEEKLARTVAIERERAMQLIALGVSADVKGPHFVNLHEDPAMSETLMYQLAFDAPTVFGSGGDATVKLSGLNIADRHLVISPIPGRTLDPVDIGDGLGDEPEPVFEAQAVEDAEAYVNGARLGAEPVELVHGDRVLIGSSLFFRFVSPVSIAAAKKAAEEQGLHYRPPVLDWAAASREYSSKQMEATGLVSNAEQEALAARISEMEAEMARQREEAQRQLEEQRRELEAARQASTGAGARDGETTGPGDAVSRSAEAARIVEMQEQLARRERELAAKAEKLEAQMAHERKQQEEQQREQAILNDTLGRVLPMVSEANAISGKLGREMMFRTALRTEFGAGGKDRHTVVYVEATDTATTRTSLWPADKFIGRVYAMRELYSDFCEDAVLRELAPDEDPFFDASDEQMIGRAQVYLESLALAFEVSLQTPIVDSLGRDQGSLTVLIEPFDVAHPALPCDEMDDETWCELGTAAGFRVSVPKAMGLPVELSKEVYIRFRWFLDEQLTICRQAQGTRPSINPALAFKEEFIVQPVTSEFVHWLEKEALDIEVWGYHTTGARPMTAAPPGGLAAGTRHAPNPLAMAEEGEFGPSVPASASAGGPAARSTVRFAMGDDSDSDEDDDIGPSMFSGRASPLPSADAAPATPDAKKDGAAVVLPFVAIATPTSPNVSNGVQVIMTTPKWEELQAQRENGKTKAAPETVRVEQRTEDGRTVEVRYVMCENNSKTCTLF
jgi:hypothetical protein